MRRPRCREKSHIAYGYSGPRRAARLKCWQTHPRAPWRCGGRGMTRRALRDHTAASRAVEHLAKLRRWVGATAAGVVSALRSTTEARAAPAGEWQALSTAPPIRCCARRRAVASGWRCARPTRRGRPWPGTWSAYSPGAPGAMARSALPCGNRRCADIAPRRSGRTAGRTSNATWGGRKSAWSRPRRTTAPLRNAGLEGDMHA